MNCPFKIGDRVTTDYWEDRRESVWVVIAAKPSDGHSQTGWKIKARDPHSRSNGKRRDTPDLDSAWFEKVAP